MTREAALYNGHDVGVTRPHMERVRPLMKTTSLIDFQQRTRGPSQLIPWESASFEINFPFRS
jgi:hypothetical protein